MKRITDALEVSRSGVRDRLGKAPRLRPPRYSIADDERLLPMIKAIVDDRLTYGYRRVCAVLNRQLAAEGLSKVNHKRVYRIMRLHGMLLARHTGKRPDRAHDGKVVTLRRNTRWSSDVFEIACSNGEKVRAAFVIDCCDREVIGHIASTVGISGELVRDMLLECVESRFGAPEVPHRLELLTDNGSCFASRETIDFADSLKVMSRFTPVRSPESNGVAEAFVKTFKRDYVHVSDCPDARTVMKKLCTWFEDYNEHHPHKGLRMKSPREFIRLEKTMRWPV